MPEGSVTVALPVQADDKVYFPVSVSATELPLVAIDQFPVTPPAPSNCSRPEISFVAGDRAGIQREPVARKNVSAGHACWSRRKPAEEPRCPSII